MNPVLIIKAGSSFPRTVAAFGDFEDWTRKGMGLGRDEVRVAAVYRGDELPTNAAWSGVVVTGSHFMVTEGRDWSERVAAWIPQLLARGVPFLGICYGHQLLARAMGGEVGYHPAGREVGTVQVKLTAAGRRDPLLGGMPDAFPAHVTHGQSVLRLPRGAALLGFNGHEPHQAFRIGTCAWGLQFHPEFSSSVLHTYIAEQAQYLAAEGQDPDRLAAGVRDTPAAAALLKRFGEYVRRPPA